MRKIDLYKEIFKDLGFRHTEGVLLRIEIRQKNEFPYSLAVFSKNDKDGFEDWVEIVYNIDGDITDFIPGFFNTEFTFSGNYFYNNYVVPFIRDVKLENLC